MTPTFAWTDWGKPQKPPLRSSSHWAEILTEISKIGRKSAAHSAIIYSDIWRNENTHNLDIIAIQVFSLIKRIHARNL